MIIRKDRIKTRDKELSGKWRVTELPDLVDDYLSLTPDPHVLLKVLKNDRINGTYQFGAQPGNLDGCLEKTEKVF
ncbi:hypothetical protein KAW65_00100 [candidate division WOR-3 bacterium]|nr:hypothetical protein [candidate division WOR-3 bacterium]